MALAMLGLHCGDDGGFFLTADDGEPLLVRTREVYDGALPSGNSVAAMNLVRLGVNRAASDGLKEVAHPLTR